MHTRYLSLYRKYFAIARNSAKLVNNTLNNQRAFNTVFIFKNFISLYYNKKQIYFQKC